MKISEEVKRQQAVQAVLRKGIREGCYTPNLETIKRKQLKVEARIEKLEKENKR